MLELAEAGEIDGHCFVVKIGNVHKAGITGDYARYPAEALQATFKLERYLAGPMEPLPEGTTG